MRFFEHISDARPPQRVRYHYEVERELAARLRSAPRHARAGLYTVVYDELFRRVPDHPQLATEQQTHATRTEHQLRMLRPLLNGGTRFLELGAGDCALSLAVAPYVREVVAVDVSEQVAPDRAEPPNFRLLMSDGQRIPLDSESIDLAYSNQLMEHLHPDDALGQLHEVARTLRSGGRYLCITPHRFSGPHDVSRDFDAVATGFHLREYTTTELTALLRRAGFSTVRALVTAKGRQALIPTVVPRGLELALARLSPRARRTWARSPLRKLLGVSLVATK